VAGLGRFLALAYLMPPRRSFAFKFAGLETMLPSWSQGPIAVLTLAGLCVAGFFYARDRIDTESKRISPADLVQLEHASIHLTESPTASYTVFDNPQGSLLVKWFQSDACTLIERHFSQAPTTTRFVPDLSRRTVHAKRPSAPVHFGASPAWAGGRCLTVQEHGEPVKTWSEPIDSCQVRAVRLYADSCRATAVWNSCLSTWSAWTWDACRH